jgi:hypothetical protein
MFAPRFNSRPVITKGRQKKADKAQRPQIEFDSLDAGFDDLAAGPQDVTIAPGLVAHFGQYPGGNANRNYHHVPALERIGDY